MRELRGMIASKIAPDAMFNTAHAKAETLLRSQQRRRKLRRISRALRTFPCEFVGMLHA